jgi:hypothetical protein
LPRNSDGTTPTTMGGAAVALPAGYQSDPVATAPNTEYMQIAKKREKADQGVVIIHCKHKCRCCV